MELDADKRVFGNPFIGQRKIGDFLQAFHVTDNGVLLAGLFRFEIELKSTNQLAIDFRQRQIILFVFLLDKFGEIAFATFITADGNQCIVLADKRTALVVVFLHRADEGADFFRLFVLPEEFLLQQTCGNGLTLLLQFIEDLVEPDFGVLNVGIQVARLAAFSTGAFLCLIPRSWVDALADVGLHSRTVYRDAHTYGGFSVFQQFGFLNEEKHIERVSFHFSYSFLVEQK